MVHCCDKHWHRGGILSITSTVAIAGATTLLKKTLDDIYVKFREMGTNHLGRARSDIKEAAIARALCSITKVKTLWNVEKEVSLHEFYYPSSITFSEGACKTIASLKELGPRQNFVIQGTAGQGKSIFLRYLCGQELIPSQTSSRVPLFVELRRVRENWNVQSLIVEALQKYKLPSTDAAWSFLASSGKFVLLMDAFDEIDPGLTGQAVADIETLAELYRETLQIIVTSRPDADIQRSPLFRVCRLMPLRGEDHLPFLQKICPEKNQAESLMRVLGSSSTEIRDLLTTPLMMTLLVILYKSLQTVPDTVPKFYEELFDVLFYRHDHSKPGFRRKRYTQLDDTKVKKLFSAFCFYVQLEGLGVLTNAQFQTCMERANKACNESVDHEKFKQELIKTVCLMQQDGFEYSFIHKSVTQYYAATFVRGSSEDFAAKFYALAAKRKHHWDLELRFLSEIDAYNFMKFYESPLVNKIAQAFDYSFVSPDEDAVSRLNNHLIACMSLMFRPSKLTNVLGTTQHSTRLAGWSYEVTSDPLPFELGRDWAKSIILAASKDQALDAVLTQELKVHQEHCIASGASETLRCTYLKDALLTSVPNLGRDALQQLQKRYQVAMRVLKTENEKIDMLSGLL